MKITLLASILLSAIFFVGLTSSQPTYDPLLDVTGDGYGGIDDIVKVAEHFGASGTPINWTQLVLDVSELQAEVDALNAIVTSLQEGKRVVAGQVTGLPPNLDNITMPVSLPGANSSNTIVVASGFKVEGSVTTPLAVQGTIQSQSTISFQVWDIDGNVYAPAAWEAIEISYVAIENGTG